MQCVPCVRGYVQRPAHAARFCPRRFSHAGVAHQRRACEMSLWLTPEELYDLTGYKHKNSQKMALGKMQVPFRSRQADGYPLVDRSLFSGQTLTQPTRRREPKLEFVR